MSQGSLGVNPNNHALSISLQTDISRSPDGLEEERIGFLRELRFEGPPMAEGSGSSVMGVNPGFMRPGNGYQGNTGIGIPGNPIIETPPVVGTPPEPPSFPIGGGGTTLSFSTGTFNSPSPPSFTETFVSSFAVTSGSPPQPPSGQTGTDASGDSSGWNNPQTEGGGFPNILQFGPGGEETEQPEEPENDPDCVNGYIPLEQPYNEGDQAPDMQKQFDPLNPDRTHLCTTPQSCGANLCTGLPVIDFKKPNFDVTITCGGNTFTFDDSDLVGPDQGPGSGNPYWEHYNQTSQLGPPRLNVPVGMEGCGCGTNNPIIVNITWEYEIECDGGGSVCCCKTIQGVEVGQNGNCKIYEDEQYTTSNCC